MTFSCLEDIISADDPIGVIHAFAENVEMRALGFEMQTPKSEDRPSFFSISHQNLVECFITDPMDWKYSSAKNYEKNDQTVLEIDLN